MLCKLLKRTPLAVRQLMKEKTRLLVAIAGIAFADLLIFVQMGFEGALYDAAVKPHRSLQADLVLINPQLQTLFAVRSFSRDRLFQALSYEGVESVTPLYFDTGQWRNPETRVSRAILVWGVDPAKPAFKSYGVHTSPARAVFQPMKIASNLRRPRTKVGIPGGFWER
jgi:putative ABC transport system permease protein